MSAAIFLIIVMSLTNYVLIFMLFWCWLEYKRCMQLIEITDWLHIFLCAMKLVIKVALLPLCQLSDASNVVLLVLPVYCYH